MFYLIQDSSYSINATTLPNIISNTLTPLIDNLNTAFKKICVSFQNCSTVVIPNYPYNQWTRNIVDPVVTANWYTDKTINFYIPKNVFNLPANEQGGYTYPPPATNTNTAKDVVVVESGELLTVNGAGVQSHTPIHVMGHFFGLPNTFDEIGTPASPPPPPIAISNEYFNRTNCYTNGDGFCDTEADPYPLGFNNGVNPVPQCWYATGPADGNSQYYVPPVDNFMSMYTCRCRFSQEQYNFMARLILKQRLYLH